MPTFTSETAKTLGDKDAVHYYEVALLEQYWGKDRAEQVNLFEDELNRRGISPESVRVPLLERAPKLDAALESLWSGQ